MPSRRAPAALVACLLALAGCGGEDEAPRAPTRTQPAAGAEARVAVPDARDLTSKPTVRVPEGVDPPPGLRTRDLVPGDGRTLRRGDRLTVQYVGVAWSTGRQFDASWDRRSPLQFTLGGGEVIAGWDRGLEGMRVGGRRLLVVPPDLGYGSQGAGQIKPNETLVFVVDARRAG